MKVSRREFFKCLAAGGAVVAGELWIPGQKLISIPKTTYRFYGGSFWMPGDVRRYGASPIPDLESLKAALEAAWSDATVPSIMIGNYATEI
jgi:hypothetical protein